jgi:hypothetical protein
MSLTASLGTAAARHSIEYAGRRYYASLVTQRIKTQFTAWLQQRAYRPIVAMERAGASPATLDRKIREFADDCTAGKYDFDRDKAEKLLGPLAEGETPSAERTDALIAFVSFVFDCSEETALGLLTTRATEVRLIMELIQRESFGPPAEGGAVTHPHAAPRPSSM